LVSGGSSHVADDFEFSGTDRYQILQRLGAGGMGVVYRALDRETETHVAVKALHARRPDALLRFKNEFRSLQGIRHPNLVRLGELGEADGTLFFTMELVDGVDFLSYVRARSEDPGAPLFHEGRLRQALAQLTRGLGALHASGKVHRDVKPFNIRIDASGRLVLLDFGLVIDIENPERLSEGWVIGTAAYMAPEQAHADATVAASDFYAVGSLLYQALTARTPFEGGDLEVVMKKQREVPPPPSTRARGVPPDLDALCTDLMQCDPSKRPSELEVLRRLGDTGDPIPLRRRRASSEPDGVAFVGRDAELEALLAMLGPPTRARARARTAVIRGPSGVGKSALMNRFIAMARERVPDAVVLSGRCYENESVPFKGVDGVVDSLTSYMRALPREQAAGLLPRNAALLAQVFPVLRRVEVVVESPRMRGESADAQELRRRAFSALRELFTRIAVRHPLVITIDDMQWADPDSLTLLHDLVQPPEPPPMTIVLCTRPATAADGTQRLDALPGDVEHFELDPLPEDAATTLAVRLLERAGVRDAAAEAEVLAREAGYHPLFLQELVEHVASVGIDRRRMVKLDDALQARFHKLSPPARRILELVCVAGTPTSQQTIAFASELDFGDYLERAGELRSANLVRTGGGRRHDLIEPYHNRIREAALRTLSPDETRGFHRALADAFEASGEADQSPEVVLHHLTAAGQNERAAYHAEIAAQRALDGLAFDRAVARYRLALKLGASTALARSAGAGERPARGCARPEGLPNNVASGGPRSGTPLGEFDEENKTRLQLALAGTLSSAGRGAEATEIYLEIGDRSSPTLRLEYYRRAAEQLLYSGHIDKGLEVVGEVLSELGDRLPKTPRRALFALAWGRFKLRLRGLRWTRRDESELRPRDVARVDLYSSLGTGLSLVDNIRGADYQCRMLRLALNLGEPKRVVRALSVEGVFISAQKSERRARAIVDMTREIADELDDPGSRAYSLFPKAAVHYFIENRWRDALAALAEAERLLHANVQSAGWETDTAEMYSCFCLLYLGELTELGQRVDRHVREADRRGDLYASVSLRTRLITSWLLADEPKAGEAVVEDALRAWSGDRDTFQVQHFFELHSRCELALYGGDSRRAAALMARGLPGLRRSMMLRLPIVAVEIGFLRGRIALAEAARSKGTDRGLYVADARKQAKHIRKRLPVARGLAELLFAGAAHLADDVDRAVAHLRAGIEALEDLETMLYVHPARRQLGHLIGGTEGNALIEAAHTWFAHHGARNQPALTALLVPGLRS
jgi:tetratricopeptide (TPR) repeat protein